MLRPLHLTLAAVALVGIGGGALMLGMNGTPSVIPEAQAQETPAEPAPAPAPEAAPAPAAPAAEAAPAVPSTLPGGASSLNEQHGDWTVNCAFTDGTKRCAFSQALVASQTGQRVLSLELVPAPTGLQGTLLMPFSLRFDAGVTLTVDEQALVGPLPFLSCVDVGCIVPVSFDNDGTARLRSGTQLQVAAVALTNGQAVNLNLSLAGFTAAQNRTAELLAQ